MTQGRAFVYDRLRVRFQDVDHAGIVFFAKIYEYCHVVYEEFVEIELGLGPQDFFEARKLGAPLVATRSEHSHPLFHGDRMTITCRVGRLGRSSMTMAYQIHNDKGDLCAKVEMTHAFISREVGFKSIPIPDELRARLEPFVGTEETHE